MNREFIHYEQALELKELGFNELCLFYYTDNEALRIYHQSEIYDDLVGAPLYQQTFRWFREKYELKGYIGSYGFEIVNTNKYMDIFSSGFYSEIYEEAELACLKKLIEIAKNK